MQKCRRKHRSLHSPQASASFLAGPRAMRNAASRALAQQHTIHNIPLPFTVLRHQRRVPAGLLAGRNGASRALAHHHNMQKCR
jgi:hypothetical protein